MNIKPTIYLNTKNPDSLLKANATVVFDDVFAVKKICVMQKKDNEDLFVSMPSRKVGNEYKNDCHAITKEFKQELDKLILDAYEQALTQEQSAGQGIKM